ncbi:FixH family protein [Shimia sp. FJ5]|uniref:FixH family protein n=1 Tax=Shimia sp. FJ5 TaxID=3079054 RepID=UPI00260ADCE7|nr:FixH family protein [Shimia sp. FJ5]MDV4143423.1 FixH family protein [Shimia sp. FJ5]
MAEKKLTGKHVAMIFVGAFGIIIAVNVALAVSAVRTFPGLEVKNSYVASQEFNTRLHDQLELGWQVNADYVDGRLILAITDEEGGAIKPNTLEAVVGRPTHVKDDVTPDFQFDGAAYVAAVPLGRGNWNIRMKATSADGTEFIQRVVFRVKKES